MLLGTGQQGIPVVALGKDKAEVAGVDALLGDNGFRGHMGDQLVTVEIQNQRLGRLSTRFTAQTLGIKFFGLGNIAHGKGKMEKKLVHSTADK